MAKIEYVVSIDTYTREATISMVGLEGYTKLTGANLRFDAETEDVISDPDKDGNTIVRAERTGLIRFQLEGQLDHTTVWEAAA